MCFDMIQIDNMKVETLSFMDFETGRPSFRT